MPQWTKGELDEQFRLTLKRFASLRSRHELRWGLIERLLAEDGLRITRDDYGVMRIVTLRNEPAEGGQP